MEICTAPCGLYRPGHAIHWIQAKLAQTQGRWRRARVMSVETTRALLRYDSGHVVTVHHHHPLQGHLHPGAHVLLTERFGVLSRGTALLCVAVENGLGDDLLPGEPQLGWGMPDHFEFSLDQVTLPYPPQEA